MPKRKYSKKRSYKSKGGKVAKAYRKLRKKQVYRKKRRVVRAHKSRIMSALPALKHTKVSVVKFVNSECRTYHLQPPASLGLGGIPLGDQEIDTGTGGIIPVPEGNLVFPEAGIELAMNDIFNPNMQGEYPAGADYVMPDHCAGFTSFSQKYAKFKVIGSKTTFKIRRLGSSTKGFTNTSAHGIEGPFNAEHNTVSLPDTFTGAPGFTNAGTSQTQSNAGVETTPSQAASQGTVMDVANLDPLMLVVIDRNQWQDAKSSVSESDLQDYESIHRHKDLGGVNWREIKPGAGQSVTFTKKWSCKGKTTVAGQTVEGLAYGTGRFYDPLASSTVHGLGGRAPVSIDKITFNIKPFDSRSPYKHWYSQARVLVTIDTEYIVKCTEPRYAFGHEEQ